MDSAAPVISPLTFARDYQTYCHQATPIPYPDTRLLAAARFWRMRLHVLEDPAFESYWREDLPVLLAGAPDLQDLHPAELEEIAEFLEAVSTYLVPSLTADTVWEMAARGWLYVGEATRAWVALLHTHLGQDLDADTPSVTCNDARDLPQALIDMLAIRNSQEPADGTDRDTRRGVARHALMDWLLRFDEQWRSERRRLSANEALCPLVEFDAAMRPVRGRLRRLQGKIDILGEQEGPDQVIFAHQLRLEDDPQIAGAYDALTVLRTMSPTARNSENGRRETRYRGKAGKLARRMDAIRSGPSGAGTSPPPGAGAPHAATAPSLRGRFQFLNGGRELYGGDSIGFACLTTAFGDHWSQGLHRERRLISADVAMTGALAADGRALAVNETSLAKKVERVFFSPVGTLAVPEPNRAAAEAIVRRLQAHHPARRLRVIGIERAADLTADHYVFVTEPVGKLGHTVLVVTRYLRKTTVHAPLLALLAYLLLCLLYPPAWPWADRSPHHLRISQKRMLALNAGGRLLWSHEPAGRIDTLNSLAAVANLDDDTDNEVCVLLQRARDEVNQSTAQLLAFDDDGELLFERSPIVLHQYPGDTLPFSFYQVHELDVFTAGRDTYILTVVSNDNPGRTHIRLWTSAGDSVGWYINAGYSCAVGQHLVDAASRTLYAIGVNNRLQRGCLFGVPLDSARGVAPPYDDPLYDLSHVIKGNQSLYIIFPATDLARAMALFYSRPFRLTAESDGLRVELDEAGRGRAEDYGAIVSYQLDMSGRLLDVGCDDLYRAKWSWIAGDAGAPSIDWEIYQQRLKDSVIYWADTGWSRTWPEHRY